MIYILINRGEGDTLPSPLFINIFDLKIDNFCKNNHKSLVVTKNCINFILRNKFINLIFESYDYYI